MGGRVPSTVSVLDVPPLSPLLAGPGEKAIVTKEAILSRGPMEILEVKTESLNIISIQKQSSEAFIWLFDLILDITDPYLIMGSFNSRSTSWGNDNTNKDGKEVKD